MRRGVGVGGGRTHLPVTSSLALHVDMPATLMAERVYHPASDFTTRSISRHWRPEPSW